MSIVTTREIDGYRVSVGGGTWRGADGGVDEYEVWIETADGVEVGQYDITASEKAVWQWAEGEAYRLACEAERALEMPAAPFPAGGGTPGEGEGRA